MNRQLLLPSEFIGLVALFVLELKNKKLQVYTYDNRGNLTSALSMLFDVRNIET